MPRIVLLALLLSACAASGPVVPAPPTVEVSRYGSELFTPEVIRFGAEVRIRNVMRGPLAIERVDYAVLLQGAPLFDDTFAELHPMGSRVTQTVTLPFQVAMADVVDRLEGVLAEEAVRVTLQGTVFPVDFAPIPFAAEQSLPLPKLPEVALDGVRGSPLDGELSVSLRVRNRNDFALTVADVESYVELNGQRYELLRADDCGEIAPGATGRVTLAMRNVRGKGLSAILNVAKHGARDLRVGGALSCRTPYGRIHLPVELAGAGAVALAR